MEQVVLVDADDREIGVMEKIRAHETGARHRAVSVFLFDPKGQILLQKRAGEKYHSGGLWSNTCCSHPRPGEPVADAAVRRLQEEMGISCRLEPAFTFAYEAVFAHGLTENEIDHVFVGVFEGDAVPDPKEVAESRWVEESYVREWRRAEPGDFTVWFHQAFDRACEAFRKLGS